jgi:hypothetical protein
MDILIRIINAMTGFNRCLNSSEGRISEIKNLYLKAYELGDGI